MAVAHFYHADFERCKIVDRHMAALASQYFNTRFIKISAPVSSGAVQGALCHTVLGMRRALDTAACGRCDQL